MNTKSGWFIGYLLIGVLFQLVEHWHLNPLYFSTWANIILWLPLILYYLIKSFIKIIIISALVFAGFIWLLTRLYPGFGRMLYALWTHLVASATPRTRKF